MTPIDPALLSDEELQEKQAIVDKMLAMFAEWEGEDEARRPLWKDIEDLECARLLANMLFDPPITDADIQRYSKRFDVTKKEAEAELRRRRK